MENIEKIITTLQDAKDTSHKMIAKRLIRLYNKTINNEELIEKDEIQRRCYNLLLEIVDDKTKRELITNSAITKIVSSRISRSSYWNYSNNAFYYNDIGNNYKYEVIHSEEGFIPKNNIIIENEFIEENNEELNVLHLNLLEKDIIFNNLVLKDEEDRELANNLIDFLKPKQEDEKTKVM